MPKLAILRRAAGSSAEVRLQALATCLGGEAVPVVVAGATSLQAVLTADLTDAAVACSADLLLDLFAPAELRAGVAAFVQQHGNVLVYGWREDATHIGALRGLSDGAIKSIQRTTSTTCSISATADDRFQHLAESGFELRGNSATCGFELNVRCEPVRPLMLRGQLCKFAEVRFGRGALFLVADSDIIDISAAADRQVGLAPHYERLLPFLVFLRAALLDALWTGSLQTSRLIIDDPLLKPEYGLLRFDALFSSMSKVDYRATLAFIPWNHWRTTARDGTYFAAHQEQLSVCVHGCDHTGGEFEVANETTLRQKAVLALERMQKHADRTGIPFEPVMVFPQGRFSRKAPAALRASGYLAAVNSTVVPADSDNDVRVEDLLTPAMTRLAGFPVFLRHYPTGVFDLAFDLFLGRPAFLVEHHAFFRSGLPSLEQLIGDLRRRSGLALRFHSISDSVCRCVQHRTAPGRGREVRVFADRCRFVNTTGEKAVFRVIKPEPDPDMVEGVAKINSGIPVAIQKNERSVECSVELQPEACAEIQFHLVERPAKVISFGPLQTGKVIVRRMLSEFRDEFLVNRPGALHLAQRAMNVLTGRS